MGPKSSVAAAILLGIGLAVAGWFIGHGFLQSRLADRAVSMKGLSERDVKADLVIWPLRFTVAGNDLAAVQAELDADRNTIATFLKANGLADDEFGPQVMTVQDLFADPYRSGPVEQRYIATQLIVARTTKVDQVATASRKTSELFKQGVLLSANQGDISPVYIFTKLNDLKPVMLAEATARAREAAEQFAKDSGAAVGEIRSASQGLFEILGRDEAPTFMESDQIFKKVRIVSTIQFALKN